MPDSLISNLFRKATTPMVPQIQQGWDQMANLVDPGPSLSDADHPYLAQLRGMLAGSMQGLGGAAAGLTSPLGMAGLAVGATGLHASRTALARQLANQKYDAAAAEYLAKFGQPKLPPTFTAVGAEPPYQAPQFPDLLEQAYQRLIASGGRSPERMMPLGR